MKRIAFLSLLLFIATTTFAKKNKAELLAGPVIGHTTPTTTRIWIGYEGEGEHLLALVDLNATPPTPIYPTDFNYIKNNKGQIALTADFTNLKPNTTYQIFVGISGGEGGGSNQYSLKTPSEDALPDFSFITGSCAMLLPDGWGWLIPGGSIKIFNEMAAENAAFMLWTGDNVYYLDSDYKSYEGMFHRQMYVRKRYDKLNNFLASMPQYAAWDDHDYGKNNADKENPLRQTALEVFEAFWPNPKTGSPNVPGNFFTFRYYDAEFFVVDDRTYRSDTMGTYIGEKQLNWLKVKLLDSDATFKFIVSGSQVINEHTPGECWYDYPDEQLMLYDFLSEHNISGVMFLSGDQHYTELLKKERKDQYTLYDFTCSPILSPPHNIEKWEDSPNPMRVQGTAVAVRNYGRIELSGTLGDRQCKITVINKKGQELWSFSIHENQLK